ncbi:MAG: hypothetical protein H6622_01930 [Halobacteriovoraceae bacterium]|nr:hypothetical protein [Halobacteriovoraceae bacterium]
MYLDGKTRFYLILFFAIPAVSFADQYLGGQIKDTSVFDRMYKNFDPSKTKEIKNYPKINKDASVTNQLGKEESEKIIKNPKSKKQIGVLPPGVINTNSNYPTINNRKLYAEYEYSGSKIFSFSLFKDTFDYTSTNDLFNKVFREDASDPEFPAMLKFGFDYFLFRSYIEMTLNVQMGLGYNKGHARFADSASTVSSRTSLFLWTLPLDIGLGVELPLYNWLKLSFVGGASALGVWQNRTDLDDEDSDKTYKQIGTGYYAEGRFKINLNKIWVNDGQKMYDQFDITGMFLNLIARMNVYNGFKNENLSVKGMSYGIGFSFEYL